MLVARWTLDFITSILPDDAAASGFLVHQHHGAAFCRRAHSRNKGCSSACSRRCTARGPIWRRRSRARRVSPRAPSRPSVSARRWPPLRSRSMTLLACAGLFTRSLLNVSRVDLGIKVDNVVTFGISPELNAYRSERSRQLFARLEDELAALPGVTGVTTALVPLLAGSNWGNVQVEDFSRARSSTATPASTRSAPAISAPWVYHSSPDGTSRRPISSAPPRSRSSTRRSRRSSTSAATPSASASAAGARAQRWTSRSSAWCRTPST